MDTSQLCTCPAVSLPSRGRHCLLVTKQKANFSDRRRALASLWSNQKQWPCGVVFLQMWISFGWPCFSSLRGLSRRFALYTFSGMLASGKQFSNEKKRNKDIIKLTVGLIFSFVSFRSWCSYAHTRLFKVPHINTLYQTWIKQVLYEKGHFSEWT